MADLQELISRGRFIFSGAAKRFEVFKLINGKESTKEISRKTNRSLSAVLHDIKKLKDMELVKEKEDKNRKVIKREEAAVYEKTALIRHVSLSYFEDIAETSRLMNRDPIKKSKSPKQTSIHLPSEKEIFDICKHGEDQLYEFKAPGTEPSKITREIAAFLHTKSGGIIFYGIDDDGTIIGSDLTRQDFDQRIQNSTRNTISPQMNIDIKERNIMGAKVIVIAIPPWDRKTIYQYTKDQRYYIRRGTNVFALQPEEIRKLSRGEYII